MVKVKEDMTGWVMAEHGFPDSRLTIIKQVEDYVDPHGRHKARWACKCSCGTPWIVIEQSNIKNGHTKSCGCYNIEETIKSSKKYNEYDLTGEFGIGYTSNTGEKFYFDLEDYDKIKDYCWRAEYKDCIKALRASINQKSVCMHQLLGFKGYDHIDRNELNNRKFNLRPCNSTQNSQNKSLQSNNSSGVSGVSWHKNSQKWHSYITVNKRRINLGFFINKDDAIKARLNAEVKYFGEFAPQKHLYEQYNVKDAQ